MRASEAEYDVYITPRIGPIQFGEFVSEEAGGRESLVRSAKYFRRTHRARAWFARQKITDFLISPRRNLGDIDAALEIANADKINPSYSDQKQADALASAECLKMLPKLINRLQLSGKDTIPLPDEQFPIKFGPLQIQVDLACLIRSVDKQGADRIGGILLNTQKGRGLGQKEETKAKRNKAGETTALLVLKRLIDEFSDMGEPLQEDALHIYLRGDHFWSAPTAFANKLKNLEAEARMLAVLWDSISPPSDFDPERATYHD